MNIHPKTDIAGSGISSPRNVWRPSNTPPICFASSDRWDYDYDYDRDDYIDEPDSNDEPSESTINVNDGCVLGLDAIRTLLPTAVLLPCLPRTKGSRDKGWRDNDQSCMSDVQHLQRLKEADGIAVLLGHVSGGLCSIDIDSDDDVENFLQLNPGLRGSLRTVGKRGCNIWIHVRGEYPKLCMLKTQNGNDWGEWRSDGGTTMIMGEHPHGGQYRAVVNTPPVDMCFNDIIWPPDIIPPTFEPGDGSPRAGDEANPDLVERYGEPVFFGNDNQGRAKPTGLNEAFWAGLYFNENVLIYALEENQFYRYDETNGVFSQISEDLIKTEISARILDYSREQSDLSTLSKFRAERILKAIVAQLRGIAEYPKFFAERHRGIHLKNTMVGVTSTETHLREFSPIYRSRNQSPVSFEHNARCDRFLDELLRPAVDPEGIILLQKYFGQCLLGENLLQRMLILDGLAERGKSQLLDIFQQVIGLHNVTQLRSSHLADRFELFRYLRKTMLVGVDVDADFLNGKGSHVIKGLVGGDWFDAEQKGGTGSFQFQGKLNIVVTSNSRLRIRLQNDVHAWRRRLLIVRVEGKPPRKKIPNFGTVLIRDEGAGIVQWGLDGLCLLLKDIEETGGIRIPESQNSIVEALLAESDSVRHFLNAMVKRERGCSIAVQALLSRYAEFCADKGWNSLAEGVVQRQLTDLMLELFQVPKSNSCEYHGKSVRGFCGVVFVDTELPK